jgi:hypothetical protein
VEISGEDLSESFFDQVDLSGARFRNVDLTGSMITGLLVDVEISGLIGNLRVNGVEVAPLIESELDRMYPDRPKMRPTRPEGFGVAWDLLDRLWQQTTERARRLDPRLLHQRVDGEWSYIETLRHLIFVTDAWFGRAVLADTDPWHPIGLPHDEMPDIATVPRDRGLQPSLDEVLRVRAERRATVGQYLETLIEAELSRIVAVPECPGYPESGAFGVGDCLRVVLDEEWTHRLYAERDLSRLEGR